MNDDIVQSSGRPGAVSKKQPNTKLTTQEFIIKSNKTHNNKYNYSKSKYTSAKHKVIIICKIHGEFFQEASYHMNNKGGCPQCSLEVRNNKFKSNTKEFIQKAKRVHGNLYDYSEVKYIKSQIKVKIICKVHGIFEQTPNNHLRERGCNLCRFDKSTSKAESDLIQYLESFNYEVIPSYRPDWLLGKELDLYLPKFNLAIEYNGGAYHHSTKGLNEFFNNTYVETDYHLNKYNLCKDKNIDLIHIFEFENLENWKNVLMNYLNNKNNFQISFNNIKRDVCFYKKDLIYYGQSYITHID